VPSKQISDNDDEAFMRSLIRPEEDRRRLYPTIPWEGGFRWFRSPNVVPIERYRQVLKLKQDKTETGMTRGNRRPGVTAR
jgi:hypothetical protein